MSNPLLLSSTSWLEEITRQQAEIVAARASAEKMRFRDNALTAENEKLRVATPPLDSAIDAGVLGHTVLVCRRRWPVVSD